MDFLVNNVESSPNIRMTRPSVEKKTSTERPIVISKKSESESDQVILSKHKNTTQEAIEKNQNNSIKTKEKNSLNQKDIQEFHEKIKENQYNIEKVNNKIVYSLMTLPAFRQIQMTKVQPKLNDELKGKTIKSELDELKKIQEELSQGEKIDEVAYGNKRFISSINRNP